jgi:hypothetical protein
MSTTQMLLWCIGVAAMVTAVWLNWYRLSDALSMYRNRKR